MKRIANRICSLKEAAIRYPNCKYALVIDGKRAVWLMAEQPSSVEMAEYQTDYFPRKVSVIELEKVTWYSNCFIEAIKAKIKYRKEVRMIHIPAKENEVYCPHWMWHDLRDDRIYDFHADTGYSERWWNFFLFKGHIRMRPYSVYERWLKTKLWR